MTLALLSTSVLCALSVKALATLGTYALTLVCGRCNRLFAYFNEEYLIKIGMSVNNGKNDLVVTCVKVELTKTYCLPIPIRSCARTGNTTGRNNNVIAIYLKSKLSRNVISTCVGSTNEEHFNKFSFFKIYVELEPGTCSEATNTGCTVTGLGHILTCRNSACIDHILSGNNTLVIEGLCLDSNLKALFLFTVRENVDLEAVNVGVREEVNGKGICSCLELNSLAEGDVSPIPIRHRACTHGKSAGESKIGVIKLCAHKGSSLATVSVRKHTVDLNSSLVIKLECKARVTATCQTERLSATCCGTVARRSLNAYCSLSC